MPEQTPEILPGNSNKVQNENKSQAQRYRFNTAYGAETVAVPEIPQQAAQAAAAAPAQLEQPVPVSTETFRGAMGFAESAAIREQRAATEDPSYLVAAGAAVDQWVTSRVLRRLARPSFENEEPLDVKEALKHLDMRLSEDELSYILDVAKGKQSFEYALQQVQNQRMAHQVMGNHPVVGLAASFLDPIFFAMPVTAPAGMLGKDIASRAAAGASSAAAVGALTALQEGPVSDKEIALNMLAAATFGAALYQPGKAPVLPADHPANAAAKVLESIRSTPEAKTTSQEASGAAKTAEGISPYAEDAKTAQNGSTSVPGALPDSAFVNQVEKLYEQQNKSVFAKAGHALAWNLYKTFEGFGPVGKKVADIFFDNNADLSKLSMESHREAILADARSLQYQYEDALREEMARRGAGLLKQLNPFTTRQAFEVQQQIEKEVHLEMLRREQMNRLGVPRDDSNVAPAIKRMADHLDALHGMLLREMKRAGVEGAEDIAEVEGYVSRRWNSLQIERTIQRLEQKGLEKEAAKTKVADLIGLGLRYANPGMDADLARKIGRAVINRALRKGEYNDAVLSTMRDSATLGALRDELKALELAPEDVDRVMQIMQGRSNEAGKPGYLKPRLDLDYRAAMLVDGEMVRITDLIDSNISKIVDRYTQAVSTQVAMAKMGLKKRSDIENLRQEFLQSLPYEKREKAAKLFDDVIAYWRGDPSGTRMNDTFRLIQGFNRTVALAWSGLWQVTELANTMAKYGLMSTLKYAVKEFPLFRKLVHNPSPQEARSIANILADQSAMGMRLRPFITRFEDGYEIDASNMAHLWMQKANEMVPYANALKVVHHLHAKITANLIVDRLRLAAEGNKKAIQAVTRYGVPESILPELKRAINQHGLFVDAWPDTVWDAILPGIMRMMDEAVMKARLGDMPHFAVFDNVGKFLFMYRSFILATHNKVLAGTLMREGLGALALVMLYQFPLALAAVQAQAVLTKGKPLEDKKLVAEAVAQMGAIGLLSEPFKWITGQQNALGAPGLIPMDRGIKLIKGVVGLDPEKAGSAALSLLPIAAANPVINAISRRLANPD